MNGQIGNEHADTLSAVIVNYNAGSGLVDLVSILIDTACVDRVVVVDNASTDGGADVLAASFQKQSKLTLVRNSTNRGFAAANNQGVAETHGEYLLFINPDITIEAGMIDHLCPIMASRPDVGMLGVLIRNPDGGEQRGCRRYLPDPHRSLMHILGVDHADSRRGIAGFNLTGTPLPSGPTQVEAISGAFMLVRRQALEEVGGWDEGYFLHCEDLDLCMRFKQCGWHVIFVPDASVTHIQGMSSRRRPLFVLWQKHLGMWRYFTKFHRRQSSVLLVIFVWLGIWAHFLRQMPAAAIRLTEPSEYLKQDP